MGHAPWGDCATTTIWDTGHEYVIPAWGTEFFVARACEAPVQSTEHQIQRPVPEPEATGRIKRTGEHKTG